MKRHSWESTESQRGFDAIERCAHCGTERVGDTGSKTLYVYRGGQATMGPKTVPDRWTGYIGVPQCVEREP
jgi:hypothetical protein